jgi:hypothetical protein
VVAPQPTGDGRADRGGRRRGAAVTRLTYTKRVDCGGCATKWDDLEERRCLYRDEDEDGLELLLFCPACVAAEFDDH